MELTFDAYTDDGGRFPSRNPPGSDRPSDSRKPMHINGPPGQGRGCTTSSLSALLARLITNPRLRFPLIAEGITLDREDQDLTAAGLTSLLLKAVLASRTIDSALLLAMVPSLLAVGLSLLAVGLSLCAAAMIFTVDLRDPTAIVMTTALGLLPERRTAAILATAEGETSTLATVLLLLPRVILVGLLLPSGATATEVRLLRVMLALPSTLTTTCLAVTVTLRTLPPAVLPPMLRLRPFLAMLPLL